VWWIVVQGSMQLLNSCRWSHDLSTWPVREYIVAAAQDLINFMNGMVPGFGPLVQRVWEGETDEQALAGELKGMHDAEMGPFIEASVAQLCHCTQQLMEDHGIPDAEACVDRKNLLASVNNIARASAHLEKVLDQQGW
jgi:hypothetical protein